MRVFYKRQLLLWTVSWDTNWVLSFLWVLLWLYIVLDISLGISGRPGAFSVLLQTVCAQPCGQWWWSNGNVLYTVCFYVELWFSDVNWDVCSSLQSTVHLHSAPPGGSWQLSLLSPHCLLLCFLCPRIMAMSVFNYKAPWWIISLNKSDSNL